MHPLTKEALRYENQLLLVVRHHKIWLSALAGRYVSCPGRNEGAGIRICGARGRAAGKPPCRLRKAARTQKLLRRSGPARHQFLSPASPLTLPEPQKARYIMGPVSAPDRHCKILP